MIDYANIPGSQAQEYTCRKLMWDDIQQLKADVKDIQLALIRLSKLLETKND